MDKIKFRIDTNFVGCCEEHEWYKEDFEEKEWEEIVSYVENGTCGNDKRDAEIEKQIDDVYQYLIQFFDFGYWVE